MWACYWGGGVKIGVDGSGEEACVRIERQRERGECVRGERERQRERWWWCWWVEGERHAATATEKEVIIVFIYKSDSTF